MEQKKFEKITFTTILHQAREELEITTNEYCVADIIYHLSNNPKSKIQGWCYASKRKIGKFIGITKISTLSIVKRLEKKGIIEKDEETKYLKTTEKWFNTVVIMKLKCIGKETMPSVKKLYHKGKETIPPSVKKVTASGKETIPNIYIDNNTYNNKDNNSIEKISFSLEDKELTELLYSLVKKNYPFLKDKTKKQLEVDYAEMNKLHNLDNFTYKQIEFIIKWATQDDFWKQNIRSVSKLRKQFNSLIIKAKGEHDKQNKNRVLIL